MINSMNILSDRTNIVRTLSIYERSIYITYCSNDARNLINKGGKMAELTQKEKRKYAKAMRRVEFGIWGRKISLFRTITLTTREGDDNSAKRFGKDVRTLIRWFRKLGYEVEYCGVYEFTPRKHLLHWHGLLRIKGGYFPITRRELGDKWNEIHHAFVVEMKKVNNKKWLSKYINKHMVKDYLNAEGEIRNKFMVSKGWMPVGWQELITDFKSWWVQGRGEIWMGREGYHELNKVMKRGCEGLSTILKTSFGYIVIEGFRVRYSEIYNYAQPEIDKNEVHKMEIAEWKRTQSELIRG